MILSDRDIRKCIKSRQIKVDPPADLDIQLGGASLDLRLGNKFRVFDSSCNPLIDVNDPKTFSNITRLVEISDAKPFVLHPNEFMLGVTLETIGVPDNMAARIDGRSSIGRLGIVIHSTAGHINPGFEGKITLEISNIGMMPVLLYPRMRICQLIFEELTSPAEKSYLKRKDSKYAHSDAPGESQLGRDMLFSNRQENSIPLGNSRKIAKSRKKVKKNAKR